MKHFMIFLSVFCLLSVSPQTVRGVEPVIDADFPGGNILFEKIEGDTVHLKQDLRDTAGNWFYWSFRIRGAEGRTLNFRFKDGVVGARGPAVSKDAGLNWRWLSDKPDSSWTEFRYEFGPDDKDVLFGMGMNYTGKDLARYLEQYEDRPELKLETLCKTKKGRDVELLRIPGRDTGFKIFFSSRHHCCEMMTNYVLEGIIDTIMSDTDDGRWLRKHGDFFIVPLLDKDGVEDGDQGKNRKPHDHNRDYIRRNYPEVKAITERIPAWLDGKPLFLLDMHCPWIRRGADGDNPKTGTNEYLYLVGSENEKIWKLQERFGTILEKEKKGSVPYKASFNLPFGRSWNTGANSKPGLLSCAQWGSTLPHVIFASSIEVPYANASGAVVDADSARALGRDLARAIRVYLENVAK